MASFRNYNSVGYEFHLIGQITGSSVVSRLPNVPAEMVLFKADENNIGPFCLGTQSGTCVFELGPGDQSGWHNIAGLENLNQLFYYNPSGSTEGLAFWIMK